MREEEKDTLFTFDEVQKMLSKVYEMGYRRVMKKAITVKCSK